MENIKNLDISVVSTLSDLINVYIVRARVNVDEAGIPAAREFDGLDLRSPHILAKIDGEPVAALRISGSGLSADLEYMAVVDTWRNKGLGKLLTDKAREYCRSQKLYKVNNYCQENPDEYRKMYGLPPKTNQNIKLNSQNIRDLRFCVVSTPEEMLDMYIVRSRVFVQNNRIPAKEEFDGNDFASTHIVAKMKDEPIGTIRIRYYGDFIKLERLGIVKEYRKSGVSELLTNKAIEFCGEKGFDKIYGLCEDGLYDYWTQRGYSAIEGAPRVKFNDLELIPIIRKIPESPTSVKITDNPKRLVMRESLLVSDRLDDKSIQAFNERIFMVRKNSDFRQ